MKPHLLSSVYGEIKEVLLVFPGIPTKATEWEYAAITEVFDAKGIVHRFRQEYPGVKITVAKTSFRGDQNMVPVGDNFRSVNDVSANINLAEMLGRWKTELETLQNGGRLSYRRWAQDPFVTLATDDQIILLQSYYCQRLTDFLLPLQLAEQAGQDFLLKPTRLYLEGGNLLCSSNCAFVGKDLIQSNQDLHGLTDGELVTQLKQALGVEELTVVGLQGKQQKWMTKDDEKEFSWQPLFHIDLFMTLGGKVGGRNCECIFLGNAIMTRTLLESAKKTGKHIYLPTVDPPLDTRLAEIRANFSGESYQVIDLPIYCFESVCYSWNNCLVEVTTNAKRVYLPSYLTEQDEEHLNPTFETLESEVEKIFMDAGFEPIWIRSGRFFRIIASHGGSLHCVMKVLRRGQYQPVAPGQ